MKDTIETKLCEIIDTMNEGHGLPAVKCTSALFEEGYVDSFGFFELLQSLEKEFDVRFTDEDLTKANFANISAIGQMIASME